MTLLVCGRNIQVAERGQEAHSTHALLRAVDALRAANVPPCICERCGQHFYVVTDRPIERSEMPRECGLCFGFDLDRSPRRRSRPHRPRRL